MHCSFFPHTSGATDIQKALDAHYKRIHEYNEIKDVGQMLLGKVNFTRIGRDVDTNNLCCNNAIKCLIGPKCAEIEGTTTREMYKKFGVDIED
jgi:hypothetical protein